MPHVEQRKAAAASASLAHVHLQFFDRRLHLAAGEGAADRADLAAIAALYRRFQAHGTEHSLPATTSPSSSTAVALTRFSDSPAPALLRVDDRVGSLAGAGELLPALVFEWSIAAVLAQVRSHVLFHAGAVSAQERGILLVGDSGHGKTTLVLALLRRGFRFLSDEVGAIERATGRLVPFPRSLLLRPGTLQRAGFAPIQDPPWLGEKQCVDVEELLPDTLGGPVPLRQIVFLRKPLPSPGLAADPLASAGSQGYDHVDLWLSQLRQSVVHEIARSASPAHIEVQPGQPVVRLSPPPPVGVLDRIERLCQSHGIFVLDTVKRAASPPAFDAPVVLERLGQAPALLHLLPHFLGSHRSPLIGSQVDVAHFAMLLGRLIGSAACYRLTVGDLQDMVDAVAGLAEEP